MSKIATHLSKHLDGEVIESKEARKYFSTDGSIFEISPKLIVYPETTTDVRKVARTCWQLAVKGLHMPITARGKGTDQAGAALGSGISMIFPAHMNKLLELDKNTCTIEPGILYKDLQRTLLIQNRFMPPYPSSIDFSTVGGAVANNASGEKSLKYGNTRDYVRSLEVVLANGQLITTERISKRELGRKKEQEDLEGEIYRRLDNLLEEHSGLIEHMRKDVSKNSAGYDLWSIKQSDGSFDLSKIITGSQGTLGIVTEVTLDTVEYNPDTSLMAIYFDSIESAGEAVLRLQTLSPSAMEVVDSFLLEMVQRMQPEKLKGLIEGPIPKMVMLLEFDDKKPRQRKAKMQKANKLLEGLAEHVQETTDKKEQERLWKIRRSAAAVIWMDAGKKKALPIIEDGCVPVDRLSEFLHGAYGLYQKYNLEVAVWGHAGDANFHMQPFLDLSDVNDREIVFRLIDDFHALVLGLGGTTTGEHNDGRLRGPYLPEVYGAEMYQLFQEVKRIFDPYNILNPGVKINVSKEDVRPLVRKEYSMQHLYDHMPRAHS